MVETDVSLIALAPSVSIVIVALNSGRLFLQERLGHHDERSQRSLNAIEEQVVYLEWGPSPNFEAEEGAPTVPLGALLVILVYGRSERLIK